MKLINNGETDESLKKGKWSPEEDQKLFAYITRYGIWNWSLMPKAAGLQRSGKSCRLRWMNYLRPTIRREQFSSQEIEMIMKLHTSLGNKWAKIAEKIHGRTDNDIKNFWNTHIRKRLGSTTSNGEKHCGNGEKKTKKRSNKTRTSDNAKEAIHHVSQEYPIAESFSFSEQSNSSGEANNLCPEFEEADWRLRDHELTIQEMCIDDDLNSYWFDHLLEEAYSGGYL